MHVFFPISLQPRSASLKFPRKLVDRLAPLLRGPASPSAAKGTAASCPRTPAPSTPTQQPRSVAPAGSPSPARCLLNMTSGSVGRWPCSHLPL